MIHLMIRLPAQLLSGLALMVALMPALPAQASSQLALDKGCYSCHGEPPRRSARTFAQLASDYAKYQGQADAVAKLAARLRAGSLFAHIAAHERLNEQECETLIRWVIDGAR